MVREAFAASNRFEHRHQFSFGVPLEKIPVGPVTQHRLDHVALGVAVEEENLRQRKDAGYPLSRLNPIDVGKARSSKINSGLKSSAFGLLLVQLTLRPRSRTLCALQAVSKSTREKT